MTVTIKGEAKDAQFSGIPGIYVLGPNSINGKLHWLKESDSNINAIWYNKGNGWSGWGIGSQDDIVGSFASILSFDGVASPQEVSTWHYYDGSSYNILDGILVQPGT